VALFIKKVKPMEKLDYIINPILMGGLVKEINEDMVKVHLHGRLGVITIPEKIILSEIELEPGVELEFHFSYLKVEDAGYDYDDSSIRDNLFTPCLVGGQIVEVNDTAVKVETMDDLGTVAVPRRWVFTDMPLECGQMVEFYLSPMRAVGKRDIPARTI
jgi:hypothetical protein